MVYEVEMKILLIKKTLLLEPMKYVVPKEQIIKDPYKIVIQNVQTSWIYKNVHHIK